jgi:SAM-dependent MidA family methyltransferase
MEGKAIQWDWIPCVSVGPITFGEPALPIIQKYNLPLIPEFGSSEEHVYEFPDRTTIVVENRLIDSISCKSNFFYQGVNLIGLSIEEIRVVLGQEDEVDQFEYQTCFDFDELCLQIWTSNETEKVETVSCYGDVEPEDS